MNRTVALLLLLCAAVISQAQTKGLGKIAGRIVDPDGAVISGATILISSGTFKKTVMTDQEGAFTVSLPPDKYVLDVEAPGFSPVRRQLQLLDGASQLLELTLPVAGSIATVTIAASDTVGYRTDAISSASKSLVALRDTPQSVTVLTPERLKDQSLTSITDVLNYVPGVMSHQGENNRDQVVIRGVSSSADFFLNGVRDDVQYFRDLYNVQRVEVLKGPNAMIFGRGGGGGVINRVTKEPQSSSSREFSFQGGSFRNRRVTADVNQPLRRNLPIRINGLYEDAQSFRRFVNRNRYGINPTLTFSPNSATQISVSYEHFHDRRTADRGLPSFSGRPANLSIETYFGNPDDAYAQARVNLLSGSFQHQRGRLNIRNRTMFGDYDRFYQNYVPGAVNATKTLVALTAYNNATQRRNFFNQTDVTLYNASGKVKHTILVGAEFGRQLTGNFRNTGFFNNNTTTVQVPFENPTIDNPITFRQSATDANNHLRTNLGATYVQDQIELRHVQLIAGLRFDYFDLNFFNKRTGDNLRRIDQLFSPRLGVVFKPVPTVSLYASQSVSYLPSSGDQFSSLTTITQQVKPEKFINYEVGAKWDVRPNLTLTTALYRQTRTNTRATDPNDPTRILQTGRQQTDGFETELSGSITRAWNMAGGYAYQDARITSDTAAARAGAIVPMVPRNTLSLWNKYQVISRLGLGLGVVRRSDVFAAIDDKVVLPAYTKIDVATFVRLAEKWRLQAYLDNVFNRRYYLNADGNNNISPGAARSIKITLTAAF